MKPAVLLCFARGVESMAAALLERADVELITLYDLASTLLRQRGIEHRNLNDFVTEPLRARALEEAEQRCTMIAGAFRTRQMAMEWPHFDAPTWPSLGAEVNALMRRDLVEQIILVDMLRRCLCEMDLRLVVVHEDICRDTKTAIMAAHRLGVPALHILHGFPCGCVNAHDTVTADVIAVYSERAKRIYEGFGARPERVIVTGNPLWDAYARPPMPGFKEQVCAGMGLNPYEPIIHCALTNIHRFSTASARRPRYHIEIAELILDAFASLARKYPSWQFLIRPHPSDHAPAEHLLARAAEAGLKSIKLDKTYAYDSVVIADALICTHSNMGIEAILQGKPVVNVDIEELLGTVYIEGMGPLFEEDDAVLWARAPEEIAPQIEAAIVDNAAKERLLALRPGSIRRFNFANDGRAMERVCAVGLDMLARSGDYVKPIARYPEFERILADAVPRHVQTVLVAGRAASYTADCIAGRLPHAAIHTAGALPDDSAAADAVVLSVPVPHDGGSERLLRQALAWAKEDGVLVAAFRHGASDDALMAFAEGRWAPAREGADAPFGVGEYCWNGVEVTLSRCGLEPCAVVAVESLVHAAPSHEALPATTGPYQGDRELEGWVVTMRRLPERLSEYGEARRQARLKAERLNRRGEARYAQGDLAGALEDFNATIEACNDSALFFNNLATALHTAGHPEEAWRRLMDAMHLDPSHHATRENVRAIAVVTGREEEANWILARFGMD